MKKIAIVYYSGTGNTKTMAEAILSGALVNGAEARLFFPEQFTPELIDMYDAVAFGCSASGVEELEQDTFEPMFSSLESKLNKKKVALFGSYGWGDGEWMTDWQERTIALGASLVANPVIAMEDPDDHAIEECKALGKALAK